MALVRPRQSRALYGFDRVGYRVMIRPSLSIIGTIFLLIWIAGWGYGGGIFLAKYRENGFHMPVFADIPKFDLLWGAFWAFALCTGVFRLLWELFGFEILRVNLVELRRTKTLLYIPYRVQRFKIEDVRNLRASTNEHTGAEGERYTLNSIAFAYGAKTHFVFSGIDIAEAQEVVEQLKRNCPQLA